MNPAINAAMKTIVDDRRSQMLILEYNTGVHSECGYVNSYHPGLLRESERVAIGNKPNLRDLVGHAHLNGQRRNGREILNHFTVPALQRRTIKQMRHIAAAILLT